MARCPGGISSRLHVWFSVMDVISSCIAFSQHGFISASVKVFDSSGTDGMQFGHFFELARS